MSKFVLAAVLLASLGSTLGGCISEETPSLALREECSGASTGDMYRYCLQVGPEEALRNDPTMSGQPMTALKVD